MKHKQTKATDISPAVRRKIQNRDWCCIFCEQNYRMETVTPGHLQIMHYIPRSQGGLGIEQNLALGCPVHHQMMDNGQYGPEMREMFKKYLQKHYKDWDEKDLVYDKWKFLKER